MQDKREAKINQFLFTFCSHNNLFNGGRPRSRSASLGLPGSLGLANQDSHPTA
jgi:hypothetical protein